MIKIVNKRNTLEGEYVGRPSPLGNPFPLPKESLREECINKYKEWLYNKIETEDQSVLSELDRLSLIFEEHGELTLSCWCSPKRCHAEVIRDILYEVTK